MKRRVSIRPEAQRDIKEAAAWYEDREPGVGSGSKMKFGPQQGALAKTL